MAAPLTADAYVRRIRNDGKRAYAAAYLAWLRADGPSLSPDGNGPDYQCSYMAAQGVRLALVRLWQPVP